MNECPRCKSQVEDLQVVDPGVLARLKEAGESNPPMVCTSCIYELALHIEELGSQKEGANSSETAPPTEPPQDPSPEKHGVAMIMAQERAKEEHRLALWKSRVQLIKAARVAMTAKQFSEAAIAYEKYLKILDIVFDVKPGEALHPDVFKDRARTTELTVVTSVYWDLVRIYDTHPKYQSRMQVAARQLTSFAPFTPIFNDIARRADSFSRSAKNPHILRQFLKATGREKSRCFVASSAFGPSSYEVICLRHFRDSTLSKHPWGRLFIFIYYKVSPQIALVLDQLPCLKAPVRFILRLLIKCVS